MDLILPLKRKWFEEIKLGIKPFEYRLNNAYWQKRLIGKDYERVIFTLGYPKRDDSERRIIKPWAGYEMQTVIALWVAKSGITNRKIALLFGLMNTQFKMFSRIIGVTNGNNKRRKT